MNLLRQAFPSGSTYRRTLGCAAIVAIAAGALLLFQLGPHRIKVGEDRLLSSALLPGHSKLFVVETRDGNILEPYAVTLYRLDQNSNVFVCFLGNESSHLWGCKLLPVQNSDCVALKAFGMTQGFYSVSTGFTWVVSKRGVSPNYLVDDESVTERIPKVVRPDG